MSLKSLVSSVLPRFPQVSADSEVAVLQDLPVETLYLALKSADAELVHWFFRNALPRQVQGLIDIDCWQGDVFLPERFELFFRSLVEQPPVKLAEYMKQLDSEIVVRGLLEHCEVKDFDRHEPIDMPENTFLISPDSKYVLMLLTEDPETREVLMQWMNRMAAADIEHMRRILEALKWEQKSDLEEFGYQVKKGRLEEMGFVDYHEALSLYSRGQTAELKKELLENPLDPSAKTTSVRRGDVNEEDTDFDTAAHSEFLPDVIAGPLAQEGFLAEAFRRVKDVPLREVLLMETLRTVNGSLSADRLLHGSIEDIGVATVRTRRYLDLGLTILSDNNLDRGAELLGRVRLDDIFRLGWLAIQDLGKAAVDLQKQPYLFHEDDFALVAGLRGRHPELSPEALRDLGLEAANLMRPEALLKVGIRLAQLGSIGKYLSETLGASLALPTRPTAAHDTALGRLMAGLLRQASGSEFRPDPISAVEWPTLAKKFQSEALLKSADLAASRCPEPGRSHLVSRLKSASDDIRFQITNSAQRFPDRRFFKGLALESANAPQEKA